MPVKAGTSPAAFRSPAATALLGATAARSTFLACCLRSIPETLADSFRLQLPLPAFAEDQSAGWAGSIATNPSSTTDSRNPRPVFTGPLPHSAISTKRDRCATGDSLPRSLPRGLPDRPLLPGSASFLSDGFPGSTLRTRYFLLRYSCSTSDVTAARSSSSGIRSPVQSVWPGEVSPLLLLRSRFAVSALPRLCGFPSTGLLPSTVTLAATSSRRACPSCRVLPSHT
jgi:hypothetical protein